MPERVCEWCGATLVRGDLPGDPQLEGHEADCPAETGPCPLCGALEGDEMCWDGKGYLPDCPLFRRPE